VSLDEKVESSEYRKDIHGVRNKITVYGVADKSLPVDKDDWTDGNVDHLVADDAEDSHQDTDYQLVGVCAYDPQSNNKIHLLYVELEARVSGATGYYKITCQKEGSSETTIVADQTFSNTVYELKQHQCDVWSDSGKDITVRFYTRISQGTDTVFSRNHRMKGDVFNGEWTAPSGQLSLDSTIEVRGTCSIRSYTITNYYTSAMLTLAAGEEVNAELYPSLNVWLRREAAFNGNIVVLLYDSGDKGANHVFNVGPDMWVQQQIKVGSQYVDAWDVEDGFNWTSVRKVRFDCWFTGTGTGSFWVDGLFFGGKRYSAVEEDSGSQSDYGLRELVEVDEELYSDMECQLRAKAILAHLKDPAEYLTVRTTVLDYGLTPILPGDRIHVTLPNENVDADFRILSVEYVVDGKNQTLEVTLELGHEQSLLADHLYALRSKTDHLSRHKLARLM
jgi:hypothetical protein